MERPMPPLLNENFGQLSQCCSTGYLQRQWRRPVRTVRPASTTRPWRQDRLRQRSMVLHVHRWCVLILCARTRFLGRDVSVQWCVTVVAKRRVFAVVAKSASSSAHPFLQKPQQAFILHRDPMRRGNPPVALTTVIRSTRLDLRSFWPRARMRAKGSALGLRAPGSNPCVPPGFPIMFGAEDVCGCDEAEGQGRGAMPTNIIA